MNANKGIFCTVLIGWSRSQSGGWVVRGNEETRNFPAAADSAVSRQGIVWESESLAFGSLQQTEYLRGPCQ